MIYVNTWRKLCETARRAFPGWDWWYVSVVPGDHWFILIRYGPRYQIFRRRRGTTLKRWGGAVLGFEFGDRGGRKVSLKPRRIQ